MSSGGLGKKILTLDLATEIGWCLGRPGEEPRWGVFRLPKGTGVKVGQYGAAFHRWLYPLLKAEQPELVAFEAPMQGGFGQSTFATKHKLGGLCFYAETLCALVNIPAYQVDAGTWKAAVCGNGRINKDMKPYPPTESLAQRGWDVQNHNAADAVCIWLYALSCVDERAAAAYDPLARRALVSA